MEERTKPQAMPRDLGTGGTFEPQPWTLGINKCCIGNLDAYL